MTMTLHRIASYALEQRVIPEGLSQALRHKVLQQLMHAFYFSYGACWEKVGNHWQMQHEEGDIYQSFTLNNIDPRYRVHVALPDRVLHHPGWGDVLFLDRLRQVPSLRYRLADEDGFRSAVYIPLMYEGEIMGLLEFFSVKGAENLPDPSDLRQELGQLLVRHWNPKQVM